MSDEIKLNTKDVIKAHVAITEFIQNDKQNRYVFASAVRIKLASNLRKTKPVFEAYEAERSRLIKELGEPIKGEPDQVKVKPENDEKFKTEIEAMLEVVTDVVLNPITYKDLGENQIAIDAIAFLEDVGLLKAS